jgi:hypothetical protein
MPLGMVSLTDGVRHDIASRYKPNETVAGHPATVIYPNKG